MFTFLSHKGKVHFPKENSVIVYLFKSNIKPACDYSVNHKRYFEKQWMSIGGSVHWLTTFFKISYIPETYTGLK